jgi:hypothetical protein
MKISTERTKAVAFCGTDHVRALIAIGNKPIEQVSKFRYLGYTLSYISDYDIKEKISLFQRLCGTIRRILYNKTRKDTQVKLYKIIAVRTLLYGSEAWTMKRADFQKIQTSEMKFLRAVGGYNSLEKNFW